jgi:hypothetical protein
MEDVGAEELPEYEVPEPEIPSLMGISIASPPETLYYARGATFDRSGLVVEGIYSDGTSRTLEETEYVLLVPPDMGLPGPKYLEVLVGELSAAFSVIVNNSDFVLSSITAAPSQAGVSLYLGESFNPASLDVWGMFTDKNGYSEERPLSTFAVRGYDKDTRGTQTVTVSANGKSADVPVTVKVPASAEVRSALMVGTSLSMRQMMDGSIIVEGHNTAFIKGQSLDMANAKFHVRLRINGTDYTLLSGDGINIDDIQGFDPSHPGSQTVTLALDDKEVPVAVYVTDIEPEVYFDYGFWRHENIQRPEEYHTVPGRAVVLSPVRVLIGYNADNSDAGVSYEWNVTPVSGGEAAVAGTTNEFLRLTPPGVGRWRVTVTVTGRNFIDGEPVSKSAETVVVCDPPAQSNVSPGRDTKHFAPGQFTEGGTGAGWSLGTFGGYWMRTVNHKASYTIEGNAFGSWTEPGTVWFQEDLNGNGEADEMWYELYAGSSTGRSPVTRRYSVTFYKSDEAGSAGDSGYGTQIHRDVYWADCKGRTGKIRGGWPYTFGAPNYKDARVTYTGTLASDDGNINKDGLAFTMPGDGGPFVDHSYPEEYPVSRAVAADGSPVTLSNVRFIKVHTGVFKYGDSAFGEISTEIKAWK